MRSFVGRFLLGSIEAAVTRLPGIGALYSSIKQLGQAFISADGHSKFQRAVAVQFPHPGVWAIGFVTGSGENVVRYIAKCPPALTGGPMVTVFVPTSPLPTQGFMMVVPVSDTLELNMTVQDALKMVVSGGMIAPEAAAKNLSPDRNAKTLSELAGAPPPSTPKPSAQSVNDSAMPAKS
jgi:uncharacterized membrane protein